jgi:endoglucanase
MAEKDKKDPTVQGRYDELLQALTENAGVGYSGNVAEVVKHELERNGVPASIEKDRSVHAFLPGAGETSVMLACHLDEIGFLVSGIDSRGFLKLSPVGGCDVRLLPGQEVSIMSRENIRGYVGIKPPHLMTAEERKKVMPIDMLFVDTGLSAKKIRSLVKIGDAVSFRGKYRRLGGDLRSAKSLDNRASVACGMMAMFELSRSGSYCGVHFVATSQEEFSGLGARIHSFRLPVNYAVVLDVTHGDHPELKEEDAFPLNKGPVIGRGGTISQRLYKLLVKSAMDLGITYQIEAMPAGTGTDADAIAFNREGIPTCVVSVPLRYMHTPVEVVSLKDLENTLKLVVQFMRDLV